MRNGSRTRRRLAMLAGLAAIAALVVACTPPTVTTNPFIIGTPQVGEPLRLDEGTWANENYFLIHTITWYSCDASGNGCRVITTYGGGGGPTTFLPTSAEQGRSLRAKVVASNNSGSSSFTTPLTAAVLPPVTPITSASGGQPAVSVHAFEDGSNCAIMADGSLVCWGGGPDALLPKKVTGVSNVVAVERVRQGPSCALVAGGTVECWGRNDHGQTGTGTASTDPVATPTPVVGLTGVLSIDVDAESVCALVSGGAVKCWGSGLSLGNNSAPGTDSPVPVTVTGITDAVAISGRCVVLASGGVTCWGPVWRQPPVTVPPTPAAFLEPRPVDGVTNAVGVAKQSGLMPGIEIVLSDGGLLVIDSPDFPKLPLDTPLTAAPFPGAPNTVFASTCVITGGPTRTVACPLRPSGWQPFPETSGVTTLVDGPSYGFCALLPNATVRCARSDTGSYTISKSATLVAGLSGVVSLDGEISHACAVVTGGGVKCWGSGKAGQLGNGGTHDAELPVDVVGL